MATSPLHVEVTWIALRACSLSLGPSWNARAWICLGQSTATPPDPPSLLAPHPLERPVLRGQKQLVQHGFHAVRVVAHEVGGVGVRPGAAVDGDGVQAC